MVGGVKADCDANKELGTDGACPAAVGSQKYDTIAQAWTAVVTDGGELTVADGELSIAATNIEKNVVINLTEDSSLKFTGLVTVAKGATLTINGNNDETDVTIPAFTTIFDIKSNAGLTINGLKLDVSNMTGSIIKTAGNVTITNSEITNAKSAIIAAAKDAVVSLDGDFSGNNIVTTSGKASITIIGGDYNADAEAFIVDNSSTLNIEGGNIEAEKEVIKMSDAKVTIGNAELTSATENTITTLGNAATASLTVNEGTKIVSDTKYALAIANAEAKYALNNGIFESPRKKAAIWLNENTCLNKDKDGVVEKLQGIITGGSYLTEIVAQLTTTDGKVIDVSAQLVKAGVAIETKDGYKVVGEGSQTNTNEQTTAPESQEPTGNTADAKNPGTSDNFMSLISNVLTNPK